MEKRYQVFLSSTFTDLREERRRVLQTLMEMDCIPAGMELFPAADEEQWEFIKKVIDDCDYYLLIVGGRYGSTTKAGISYTEKEYDYAVSKDIKVIGLLHEKPDDIALGKSELDPDLRLKLEKFREKVSASRLVRTWNRAEDLPGLVSLSLTKAIKAYPAIGWVRANTVADKDLLIQLNQLRQENEKLRREGATLVAEKVSIDDLAGIDEIFRVRGQSWQSNDHWKRPWEIAVSWKSIFSAISPYLASQPSEATVKSRLTSYLKELAGRDDYYFEVHDQDFQTIGIQLKAAGLIRITYAKTIKGGMALFWTLTSKGEALTISLRTIRTASASASHARIAPIEEADSKITDVDRHTG